MNIKEQIEEILLNDFGSFDDYTVEKLLNLHSVSFSLPTDDEIIDKHNSLKTVHGEVLEHTKDKLHRLGYYRGARWMRELINNES